MNKYQKILKPKDAVVKSDSEIRVTAAGSVSAYIGFAAKVFGELDKSEVKITATGNALTKAVTVAEIIKHRFKGLHQITHLGLTEIVDEYEPLEEGLDRVVDTRMVPVAEITLSKEQLDTSDKGYQPPIDESLVTEVDPEEMMRGRGRGRNGGGKGKAEGKGTKGAIAGKGKGKGKGRGKNMGDTDDEDDDAPPPRGKKGGKAKGAEKGMVVQRLDSGKSSGKGGKDMGKGMKGGKGKVGKGGDWNGWHDASWSGGRDNWNSANTWTGGRDDWHGGWDDWDYGYGGKKGASKGHSMGKGNVKGGRGKGMY